MEVYDIYTGNKLWESEPQADFNPFGYYSWVSLMNVYGSSISHGKLFTTGYTGAVYAYDLINGTLTLETRSTNRRRNLQVLYTLPRSNR